MNFVKIFFTTDNKTRLARRWDFACGGKMTSQWCLNYRVSRWFLGHFPYKIPHFWPVEAKRQFLTIFDNFGRPLKTQESSTLGNYETVRTGKLIKVLKMITDGLDSQNGVLFYVFIVFYKKNDFRRQKVTCLGGSRLAETLILNVFTVFYKKNDFWRQKVTFLGGSRLAETFLGVSRPAGQAHRRIQMWFVISLSCFL